MLHNAGGVVEMATRIVADTLENQNVSHEHVKERLRAFAEAVRVLAWDHGFRPSASHVHEDYDDWDVRIEFEFQMDYRIPPKDRPATGETIRLEEGRHEAL
jgi:hypothetical protein